MNVKPTAVTYTVPSQSGAGVRYTVTLLKGQTCCSCPWGKGRSETPTICLRSRLVLLLEWSPRIADLRRRIAQESYEQARLGAFREQLYIVRCLLDIMLERSRYAEASRCAEMIAKYLRALSFAGAEPARVAECRV